VLEDEKAQGKTANGNEEWWKQPAQHTQKPTILADHFKNLGKKTIWKCLSIL
jgi:hypothetical protein